MSYLENLDDLHKKHDESLKEFIYENANVTGVIKIEPDNWFGDSFVVIIDRAIYIKDSIPESYDGFAINIYNVYGELETANKNLKMIQDSYAEYLRENPVYILNEFDPGTKNAIDMFTRQIEYCQKIISEYEK